MVSILDEAVLSLADNDLSIDNIKLALEDIILSDGITLADLYSEVLDNTSSMKLDTLLLKQNTNDISINSKKYSSETKSATFLDRTILLGIICFIIVTILVLKKKKIRILDGIRILIICLIIAIIFAYVFCIIFDFFDLVNYKNEDIFIILDFIVSFILSIILYSVKLHKYKINIFKHIIILIILPIIWSIIFDIIYDISDYETAPIILVSAFVILSWIILTIASFNDGV